MQSPRRMTLAVLSLLVFGVLAFAQKDAKPLSAIPSGFHFEGSWNCDGAFANGKSHRSTMKGSIVVGDKWLELTEQDTEPATGYIAKYLIGYDAQQKQLVEFDANNFSAAVYTSSQGWQNKILTMTSQILPDPKAPYAANRFLYSITGADSFSVEWQISKTADLNWLRGDYVSCQRRP